MNHQAGMLIFESNDTKNIRIRQEVVGDCFALSAILLESSSKSTWHVPHTGASNADLRRVVDCFVGKVHHSFPTDRDTGPAAARGPTTSSTE